MSADAISTMSISNDDLQQPVPKNALASAGSPTHSQLQNAQAEIKPASSRKPDLTAAGRPRPRFQHLARPAIPYSLVPYPRQRN